MFPQAVKRRHKDGINVLYANGSAQWVEWSRFAKADHLAARYKWVNIPPEPVSVAYPGLPEAYVYYHPRPDKTGGAIGVGLWNWLDQASR